jgi:transglutaminase-like putative cysteine protease
MTDIHFENYLKPGKYIDSDNNSVRGYANNHKGDTHDKMKQVVNLYYAVRDDFKYDPFHVDLKENEMKASAVLNRGSGYCIEKAGLLAACARVIGVPSRIGMADVRNHVGAEKLQELLRSDVFACHGFTELFLNGKWVKATPAFNKSLCEKLGEWRIPFSRNMTNTEMGKENLWSTSMTTAHLMMFRVNISSRCCKSTTLTCL